ncbi:MAG: response regulator [Thiolinea sp.]
MAIQSEDNTRAVGNGRCDWPILYNFCCTCLCATACICFYITKRFAAFDSRHTDLFNPEPLGHLFASSRHPLRALGNLTIIFFILFTLRFMQPGIQQLRANPEKKRLFIWVNAFIYFGWLMIILMSLIFLATLFHPDNLAPLTRVNNVTFLSALLLVPLISLLVAIGGYRPAWVFLPAWTILAVGHVLFALDGFRIIELQGLGPTYASSAAALEMVLLSIALGMSLRDSQLARDRAQTARENAELRMQQQEKFVSTLSHEIRTPLHAMLGSTTLLGHTALSEKQKTYWDTTHYAAESMFELVDNLLDRTQAKQAKVTDKDTVFEPQRLLEAMIRLLRNRAEEKQLSLFLHSESLPQHLRGNPVVLRRVLINLISNAVKYTDAGEINVYATWSGVSSVLHVSVQDTGHGMSVQQRQQVQQAFNLGVEALYSQQASSGLGLPICFEMLQEAGGQLRLDSQPGQGTTVHFSLPMQLPDPSMIQAQRTTDLMADAHTTDRAMTILVVDDVETNRLVARDLLESAGHQVSTAESGQQALALMRECPFDAVLSDVRMPEMDGMQLLEALRREYSADDLIIVMTSGHFDAHQQETLLAMGASVCLPKPHSPQDLLTAIQGIDPKNRQLPASKTASAGTRPDVAKSPQVLALYDQQLQEDIHRITQAVSQRDRETIRIAAHRIVSASRALGFDQQAEAALRMETYHEEQLDLDWDDFQQLINQQLRQLVDTPIAGGDTSCA